MTTPAGTYFDGDYSVPVQHGPVVPRVDQTTRSKLFTVRYHQSVADWKEGKWSTRGPENSFLVEESAPQSTEVAGVVEWTRTYAHVPASRFEYQEFLHQQQDTLAGFGIDIIQNQVLKTARARYDYFHTLTPETIPLFQAFKATSSGGLFFSFGKEPASTDGWIVAENSILRRWKGNIYERMTLEVKKHALKEVE